MGSAATSTNIIEFANTQPKPGSIQWQLNHEMYQQSQELHRKRISVQDDAESPFVPRAASAKLINGQPVLPEHLPPPQSFVRRFFDLILFTLMVLLAAGLVARRHAPQILDELNQRYNPWAPPHLENNSRYLLEEEKPFDEFVTALRAGPVAPPPADAEPEPGEMMRREFYARAKKRLASQRRLLEQIRRESADAARKKYLVELYYDVGGLKDEASFPGALPIWQVASALEGLLKELSGKIRNATPSTLRTIEGALDLVQRLCVPDVKPGLLTGRPLKFLVVDDDIVSRQALSLSLKKAFSQPDLAVDAPSALVCSATQAYDVIFLDVQMPGLDGFELCQKIHGAGLNRATPVVFVTATSDFDARAKSTLVGGNDLMAKPFLIFEVTVKALTLGLQSRLDTAHLAPVAQAGPAPEDLPAAAPLTPVIPGFVVSPALARRTSPAAACAEMNDATKAFLNRLAVHLGPLRELSKALLDTADASTHQNLLADGFLRLNALSQNISDVVHPAYQLTRALEGLIRKLLQDTQYSTPSALATVAAGVELLDDLCVCGPQPDLGVNPPIRLMVVDDDLVARRALAGALQTTFEKPESVESGEAALARAQDDRYDVIFLDLQMPGMNGFETCTKIHETGCNRETPVVYITANADFAVRAEATRTSGVDLVGKPFLTSEINVKALTFALRGRLKLATQEAVS